LYTIQKNDTLGVLAFRYGVSVAEIEVLNPGLNAYLLSVGTVITIPASAADATPTLIPTPLPAAVTLDPPQCYLAADGGWWCLALARNPHAFPLENVTAWLSLASADGEILAGQPAIAPLNLLAPGAALPLSAYFPAPLPAQVFPQAQLLTSIPAVITDTRYLPVGVELHLVEIAPGGLSARAEGRVTFPGASAAPSQVWVALTAFDASGRPVGFRRWEAAGEALLTSEVLISASLYSLGPRIASVEAWAEARP
jgi:LysM repeat protein